MIVKNLWNNCDDFYLFKREEMREREREGKGERE